MNMWSFIHALILIRVKLTSVNNQVPGLMFYLDSHIPWSGVTLCWLEQDSYNSRHRTSNIELTQDISHASTSHHYDDVIMTTIASQITSLTIVYSTVYSDADQSKHQSSVSLAFVWGIHRDRWIPRTKGRLRGKCFHLMTSSCVQNIGRHL